MEAHQLILLFIVYSNLVVENSASDLHVCLTMDRPGNVSKDFLTRHDDNDRLNTGLQSLYDMTNFFLEKMVQPRYLTWMRNKEDLNSIEGFKNSLHENSWQWLEYGVGYIICGLVGVLTVIVTYIVVCCQCCGKCRWNSSPRKPNNSKCQYVSCSVILLVVTLIIIAGGSCMLVLNDGIKEQVVGEDSVFDSVSASLRDMEHFLVDYMHQVNETLLGGYVCTTGEVFPKLHQTPAESVEIIKDKAYTNDALLQLKSFMGNITEIVNHLDVVDKTVEQLVHLTNELETELKHISRTQIGYIVGQCISTLCINVLVVGVSLKTTVDYSVVNVTKSLTILRHMQQSGELSDYVGQVNETSDEIRQRMQSAIQESDILALTLKKDIHQFVVDLNNTINRLSLDELQDDLKETKDAVRNPWLAVYGCGVALVIILFIVCLFNLVGVISGCFWPSFRSLRNDSSVNNYRRSASSFLSAGITLTLVFYWLYMIFVTIMFIAGGVVHTEICRHIIAYEQPDSRQVLDIFDNLINQRVYEATGGDVNLTIMDTYENCQRNRTFYSAMGMKNKGHDVSEVLDVTQLENSIKHIAGEASNNIDDGYVNFTSPTVEVLLHAVDFVIKDELTYLQFYDELYSPITSVDLTLLAAAIFELRTGHAITKNETFLNATVDRLNSLNSNYVVPMTEMAAFVTAELQKVEENLKNHLPLTEIYNALADDTTWFSECGDAIHEHVTSVVEQALSDIENFVSDAISLVEHGIGRCWPLYDAMTDMAHVTCVRSLHPINASWLCLSWCVVFLIPSLLISCNLKPLYRDVSSRSKRIPEDEGDVYAVAYDKGEPTEKTVKQIDEKPILTEEREGIENQIYHVVPCEKLPIPDVQSPVAPYGALPPAYSTTVDEDADYNTKL